MKIYFDGCSYTRGDELDNPEEERFSKIICDELGAEETNLALSGGSNDRIIRNLLVENNIEEYDYAVIQMTFPTRTEYWDSKWRRINPSGHKPLVKEHLAGNISEEVMCLFFEYIDASNTFALDSLRKLLRGSIDRFSTKFSHHRDFWTYYYTKICNMNYFHVKEKIHYETIKSYCTSKDVPLILCSINEWSKLNFDYLMKFKKIHRAKGTHPNKIGHQIIAKTILGKM